jgi:hypothetical protein
LRGPFPAPLEQPAIEHTSRQVSPDEPKNPPIRDPRRYPCHQPVVIDPVKKGFDIQIEHPVVAPAAPPRHTDCIERRFAGSISVGVVVEMGFHEWLQVSFDYHLGDAVGDRRYP